MPHVKNVIAIASGKGDIGKSTTSVGIVAMALADTGAKVGLLDGEVPPEYPLMMGLKDKPQLAQEGGKIVPCRSYGVKLMSIGFFLNEDKPVVLAVTEMVHGAIQQFLRDVDWGDLDYLVIDLPQGTGDPPVEPVAVDPALGRGDRHDTSRMSRSRTWRRAWRCSGQSFEVRVVRCAMENMSYFCVPRLQREARDLGQGGGEHIAGQFGVPFLGKVPLQQRVREGGDRGRPVVVTGPK